jgi:CxxC motif-containing protein (DUF1111 family)
MKRLVIVVLLMVLAVNVSAQRRSGTGRQTPDPAAGDALAGLTAAQRTDFTGGLADFTEVERVTDGLGPVFNERSCAACHSVPATGGGSNRLVTRFATRVNGLFDALASLGGSLVQDHAIGPQNGVAHVFRPEVVPAAATIIVRRRTTPLFGLGLVDATPDSDFIAAAAQQAARNDGVAGRVNMVDNIRAGMKTVGKFGWKAQVPSLFQFSGDAYLNEMGITTPDFPSENCPQGNCAELAFNPAPGINDDGSGPIALTNYMALLAAPPRGTLTGDAAAGEATFERIGCAACHVATQHTGSNPIAALDRKTYHPYSDFLLHDMGVLGDDLEMGSSTGREMRTAPLWGLRFINNYLHDGRARTLDQAILAHDGQARGARDQFAGLAADAKAKLMAFLDSL